VLFDDLPVETVIFHSYAKFSEIRGYDSRFSQRLQGTIETLEQMQAKVVERDARTAVSQSSYRVTVVAIKTIPILEPCSKAFLIHDYMILEKGGSMNGSTPIAGWFGWFLLWKIHL